MYSYKKCFFVDNFAAFIGVTKLYLVQQSALFSLPTLLFALFDLNTLLLNT